MVMKTHKKPKKLVFMLSAKVEVDLTNDNDLSMLSEVCDQITQYGEVVEITEVGVVTDE